MAGLRKIVWAVAVAAALAGCVGEDDSEPGEEKSANLKTPGGLIAALSDRAGQGDVDGLVELLTKEARAQGTKAWMGFISRTGSKQVRDPIAKLPAEQRGQFDGLTTRRFLEKLQELAPGAFSRLFLFYPEDQYEEEGRVLVYAGNAGGEIVYLGMRRTADETLRLMGEKQSAEVYEAYRDALARQQREEAREKARKAQEALEELRQQREEGRTEE